MWFFKSKEEKRVINVKKECELLITLFDSLSLPLKKLETEEAYNLLGNLRELRDHILEFIKLNNENYVLDKETEQRLKRIDKIIINHLTKLQDKHSYDVLSLDRGIRLIIQDIKEIKDEGRTKEFILEHMYHFYEQTMYCIDALHRFIEKDGHLGGHPITVVGGGEAFKEISFLLAHIQLATKNLFILLRDEKEHLQKIETISEDILKDSSCFRNQIKLNKDIFYNKNSSRTPEFKSIISRMKNSVNNFIKAEGE